MAGIFWPLGILFIPLTQPWPQNITIILPNQPCPDRNPNADSEEEDEDEDTQGISIDCEEHFNRLPPSVVTRKNYELALSTRGMPKLVDKIRQTATALVSSLTNRTILYSAIIAATSEEQREAYYRLGFVQLACHDLRTCAKINNPVPDGMSHFVMTVIRAVHHTFGQYAPCDRRPLSCDRVAVDDVMSAVHDVCMRLEDSSTNVHWVAIPLVEVCAEMIAAASTNKSMDTALSIVQHALLPNQESTAIYLDGLRALTALLQCVTPDVIKGHAPTLIMICRGAPTVRQCWQMGPEVAKHWATVCEIALSIVQPIVM